MTDWEAFHSASRPFFAQNLLTLFMDHRSNLSVLLASFDANWSRDRSLKRGRQGMVSWVTSCLPTLTENRGSWKLQHACRSLITQMVPFRTVKIIGTVMCLHSCQTIFTDCFFNVLRLGENIRQYCLRWIRLNNELMKNFDLLISCVIRDHEAHI